MNGCLSKILTSKSFFEVPGFAAFAGLLLNFRGAQTNIFMTDLAGFLLEAES